MAIKANSARQILDNILDDKLCNKTIRATVSSVRTAVVARNKARGNFEGCSQ
jgi:hypothetical protein